MRTIIRTVAIPAMLIASSATFSQSEDPDGRVCRLRTMNDSVAACTRLIERPKLARRQLAQAYGMRGAAYRFKRDLDKSLADYDKAIQLEPNFAALFNGRGYTRLQKAKYSYKADADRFLVDSAIVDLQNAIRLDPKGIGSYVNLVDAYRATGDMDGAYKVIEDGFRAVPDSGGMYFSRAGYWRIKGDFDKAIADYRDAVRLNFNAEISNLALGILLERKGDLAGAKAAYLATLASPISHDGGAGAQENARKRLATMADREKPAPTGVMRGSQPSLDEIETAKGQ
jgi:tetratricopeptide (TPR) repeat protein